MKFNEFYMDKFIRYVVAARNLDYQTFIIYFCNKELETLEHVLL